MESNRSGNGKNALLYSLGNLKQEQRIIYYTNGHSLVFKNILVYIYIHMMYEISSVQINIHVKYGIEVRQRMKCQYLETHYTIYICLSVLFRYFLRFRRPRFTLNLAAIGCVYPALQPDKLQYLIKTYFSARQRISNYK